MQTVEAPRLGAAVLLSGGVDSAVVLALLADEGPGTTAIWIDYGQPAAKAERYASKAIAASYGSDWVELGVRGLAPPADGEFPGRNDLLVALAGTSAPGRLIAIGVHAGTGYADCSPSWIETWQELRAVQHHGAAGLLAPLADLTKAQVFALADNVGIPIDLTYSCEAAAVPCGQCSSCADRRMLDARP